MIKSKVIFFLIPVLTITFTGTGCASTATSKQVEATTAQGEKVILFPDGTWKYKKQGIPTETLPGDFVSVKPAASTEVLVSKKNFAQLWYDPDDWKVLDESPHPLAEFFLVHREGEAFATVVAERITTNSTVKLKELSLQMTERAADRLEVLWEEKRFINDKEILVVRADISIQGIEFAYLFYYWSGEAGNLVISTWTGKNIFDDYSQQMTTLLSGLILTKD